MAAPSSPYCDSTDVAMLLRAQLDGDSDFSSYTVPTKVVVDNLIQKYSGWVDMTFAQVGFYVPWQELSGESWPTHQTYMLNMIASFGVAGAVVGPVIKPAPAMGRAKGTSDNEMTQIFKDFLGQIKENGFGFRADHRVGSPAENFVRVPLGPVTDYLLGYVDRTRMQTTGEFTAVIENTRIQYQVAQNTSVTDHMANRRRELIGI